MKRALIVIVSVVCSLVMLYILFRPGYVYENGTWNYVSYDEAAGRRVSPIDAGKDEFQVLKHGDFARDGKSVYFKKSKIEGSDPDTFQVISAKGRYCYARDKDNVYVYASDGWSVNRVIGADPESFEVLEFPYARDKNDAFCGSLPLYVDDVAEFKVIEGARSSIESVADSFLGTISGKRDGASEDGRKRLDYNREKYGFITEAVFYAQEGKARTDQLIYEGYRLVEGKQ